MRKRSLAEKMRCEWCSAYWWDGAELEVSGDTIQCIRGHGCARRHDAHERFVDGRWEYLLEGHWYTVGVISALAEKTRDVVGARLRSGWLVRDVIDLPVIPRNKESIRRRLRSERSRAILDLLDRKWKLGATAEHARAAGISEDAFRARVRRHGIEAAIAMGGRRAPVTNPNGRPPTRGRSADAIAAEVGLTRQGLWKAARKRGWSIEEEAAMRLEQKEQERAA